MDQLKSNFTGDYSDFRAVKNDLDELSDNEFYRMDLTYNRARMDPAWFGYNGVSTFSSMAYERMSNMQSNLGIYGNYINSYTYHLQTPVYNMMHSLKYIVDNDESVHVEDDYYNQLMSSGKFTAYENEYFLPIGFAVNSDLSNWQTDITNPFTVQSDWFEYSTGVSDVFGMMRIDEIQYYNMDEITSGLETGDIYFTKSGEGSGELTFILKTDETKHCYLFTDSYDFDSIIINKGDESVTQYTDEPYIYDLGIVTPEEDVRVVITIEDSDYGYIDFYPYFVNDDKLNEGYEILKSGAMNVESFEETKIKGTVSTDKDSLFFTSIPYDKGWTVKVDGTEIAEDDYIALQDAYLCFNLPAGEHSIEISFMPQGILLGAGVSALTVIALIAAAIIFAKRRKSNVNAPFVPVVVEIEAENSEEPVSVEIGITENEESADEEEFSLIEEEISQAEEIKEASEAIENVSVEEASEDTENE